MAAHELAHIQHTDVVYHMQQAAMAAGFAEALDLGWSLLTRPKKTSNKHEDEDSSAAVAGIALLAVGALQYALGTATRLASSRDDEFVADSAAAQIPGGAQALARALIKIEAAARVESVRRDALGHAGGALAAIVIANEAEHDVPSRWIDWLAAHPSTRRRVVRLRTAAAARSKPFRLKE